jgi:hypothetical protein
MLKRTVGDHETLCSLMAGACVVVPVLATLAEKFATAAWGVPGFIACAAACFAGLCGIGSLQGSNTNDSVAKAFTPDAPTAVLAAAFTAFMMLLPYALGETRSSHVSSVDEPQAIVMQVASPTTPEYSFLRPDNTQLLQVASAAVGMSPGPS